VIFDLTPQPPARVDDTGEVPAEPSGLALAGRAALDLLTLPARALAAAADQPSDVVHRANEAAQAAVMLVGSGRPAVSSSLCGPIGRQRRYAWARASLNDIKDIKQSLGGTVNDVVLAAITAGFRSLLLSRDEKPEPHMVPSLVPVSLRAPGEENIYENRVSAIIADLPVHLASPVERLAAIRTEMAALKAGNEAAAGEALISLGRYTPYWLTSQLIRAAYRLPQREIVTVTTNVPGPRQPLYGMGRKLVEIIPWVPIATTLRLGVSIFSYCDQVIFGITGDYDTTPDIDVFARAIEKGVRELRKIARQRTAAADPA
jgi:WS/DGAT/MGAT family acyltransferase